MIILSDRVSQLSSTSNSTILVEQPLIDLPKLSADLPQPSVDHPSFSSDVPQNYRLPYHPVTHRQRLEHIYRSVSPSLEQKLDMMVSLIEEGDESCFQVSATRNTSVERKTPIGQEQRKQLLFFYVYSHRHLL